MDSPSPAREPAPQPKISQRMLLRFAIGLFIVAALFFGYRWWKDYSQDPDLPRENDTKNLISAMELLDEGSRAVVIDENGEVIASPDYTDGKNDQTPVWQPDGNRLFFVSDREEGSYNVFRWNLASKKVMRRSVGTRSVGWPVHFAPNSAPGANESMLVTSGGVVLEFFPRDSRTAQVLPPVQKERGGGEEGAAGQFEQTYQQLGTSFRMARWSRDKKYIAAVMRREDESEILIIQDTAGANPPQVIISGKRIEVDADPAHEAFVFLVNGFRFHNPEQIPPESIKDGKVVVPFTSVIGKVDPDDLKTLAPILSSNDEKIGFQHIRVSPDGNQVAAIAGKLDANMNFEPSELFVVPAQTGGAKDLKRLIGGRLFEPAWHPNSQKLVFTMYDENNKRSIFTINTDGSGLANVTGGKGEFKDPAFSPQSG